MNADPERESKESELQKELVGLIEKSRTLRTACVCATIVAGMICTSWVIVRIATDPLSPWKLIAIVVAALGPPIPVIKMLMSAYGKLSTKSSRRTRALEKRLDPDRSSSDREGTERRGGD